METEKKYLKTIEEVSDALAAGKVIYDKYKTKSWKDKNGFIVCENLNGNQYLKFGTLFVEDELYILEKKPLEVKLMHLYKDAEGKNVLIYRKQKNKNTVFPFIGQIFSDNCNYGIRAYSRIGETNDNIRVPLVEEVADLSRYFEKEQNNGRGVMDNIF